MNHARIAGSRRGESGIALFAVLATLVPLIALVMASSDLLRSRSKSVGSELDQEKALLAAESGIDYIVYKVNTSTLVMNDAIKIDLGGGLRFAVVAKDLGTDLADNDGDSQADEDDEQGAVELRSTGRFRHARRTLVAYIRPMVKMPMIDAAVSFQDFTGSLNVQLDANGNAFNIRGADHNIDGSPGTGPATHGVAIVEPGTVANLMSQLTAAQQNKITGLGGPPSATTTTNALDIVELAGWAESVANNYIQPGHYSAYAGSFGNAASNDWQVTYCGGDLDLSGSLTGAGVLVVTGDLEITGTVQFKGLVVVTGDITLKGGGSGSVIRGGLMAGANVDLSGNVDIEYSGQVIQIVKETLAEKKVVTGWREVGN